MAKFVKKTDVVEVFRFEDEKEIPEWVLEAIKSNIIKVKFSQPFKCLKIPMLIVNTPTGIFEGKLDDYISINSYGEISAYNFELFNDIYQKVEYTATIENTRNYAENIKQGHRYVDEEKNKESKLELSARLELDTKDFEENIKSATKEIDILNEAVDRLEKKINRMFGREKVNEVKINIPTISKSGSVEKASESLLKELKSQKLIVSEKDKKFKKYDICFKNGECISGVIKEYVADKLTTYFSDSQSDIDCLKVVEDEEKLVMFNAANVQAITISNYIW